MSPWDSDERESKAKCFVVFEICKTQTGPTLSLLKTLPTLPWREKRERNAQLGITEHFWASLAMTQQKSYRTFSIGVVPVRKEVSVGWECEVGRSVWQGRGKPS